MSAIEAAIEDELIRAALRGCGCTDVIVIRTATVVYARATRLRRQPIWVKIRSEADEGCAP